MAKKGKDTMNIRPLGDKVIIKELETKEAGRKTDSGIYIPETVKEDREGRRGKVVAVGPGRLEEGKRIAVEVKVGDSVLFSWGDKVTIDGGEYWVVPESSVIAIIK